MSKKVEHQAALEHFLSAHQTFETRLNGAKESPFHAHRKNAIQHLSEIGFPVKKDEEWKYTSVSPLLKHGFKPATSAKAITPETLKPFLFEGFENNLIVFINGEYTPALSNYEVKESGVIITNLQNALENHSDLVNQYINKYTVKGEAFTALNTAFADEGIFIYVPKSVAVEAPVHLLFLTDAPVEGHFSSPRNLVIAEENSQVKILESHHALNANAYFTNAVLESVVMANANVDHVRVQDDNPAAYHIFNAKAHQEKSTYYSLVNIDLGGNFVRNNLNIDLMGEHCESHLIGFYMGTEKQHKDSHTTIDHAMPNCYSNEIYKGILGGKSKGVFNGKIFVREDAQKTNAYQDNKALLLTDDAVINTKPQLEIFADDVKCSHGATIGQLDDEAIFYLQSRGIPKDKAISLMQHAFASDVFNHIKHDSVKEKLDQILSERFPQL